MSITIRGIELLRKFMQKNIISNSVWIPTITIWISAIIILSFMYYASGKAVKMYGDTELSICKLHEIREQISSEQLRWILSTKSIPNQTINSDSINSIFIDKLVDSINTKIAFLKDEAVLQDQLIKLSTLNNKLQNIPLQQRENYLTEMKIVNRNLITILSKEQIKDLDNFKKFRAIILSTVSILLFILGLLISFYNKKKVSDDNKIKLSISQLEEQKSHLENLIESTPTAIAVVDNDDYIKRINHKFTDLFGFNESEVIGKKLSTIIISEEYLEEGRALSKISQLKNQRTEKTTKRKHKDGHLIDVYVIGSPIIVENNVEGIYAIYQDIREQKKYESELIKSKKHAENADKLKSVFLAQMSHEIRTPINAMVSLASLLKEDLSDNVQEDHQISLDLINKSGARIIRTVDLLLNLSEIQTGTYQTIIKKFDLFADVLSKLLVDYRKLASEKNIEFSTKIVTTNTEILADLYTVNQIFDQLLDNAIKYTEDGSITLHVQRDSSKNLIVEIIDTGIGISKEYLKNLFEPFSQEEMGYSRKYEGNGIGLTLVKNYCDLNNAKIEVESKKNIGSTFRVKFNHQGLHSKH